MRALRWSCSGCCSGGAVVLRALLLLLLLVPALASAEPGPAVLLNDRVQPRAEPAVVAKVLYLNRCAGGCTVHGAATDDATTQTSSLPCNGGATCGNGGCSCPGFGSGTFAVHEFTNDAGQAGSAADADWAAVVQCVKEVYSPYGVQITDQLPTNGISYNEAIVAGVPEDIGYTSSQVGGIAHVSPDCSPQNDIMSFSFANLYHGQQRVNTICYVAAQETAHSYGLDHEYVFLDGTSACKDPMSYRGDCGGQRFFRNAPAKCGEFAPRTCNCGGTQNSHLRILAAAGPGTPITRPPTVSVTSPTAGAAVSNGVAVQVLAGAQRGVANVELWLNGYKWAEVPGAPWGSSGQADPSSYQLAFPASVPDGVIDIQIKAYDDIPVETDAPIVTVTKGAPCTTADACAKGQKCDAGKCYWDPPSGMLGDACTYPQFCTSGICSGTPDKQICTEACLVGASDTCEMGYDCIMTDGVNGVCFPSQPAGGCCSASGGAMWANAGLSAIALGLVVRRRRRR